MDRYLHECCIFSVTLLNFERGRAHRAYSLLDKVNSGELVDSFDLAFLDQIFAETHTLIPMFARHPEYHDVTGQILGLCEEITHKAFENEISQSPANI